MTYPFPEWRGKDLLVTRSAAREMVDENISIHEIIEVLEDGFDCSASKRKSGTLEKCKRFGREITKAVVVDMGDNWRLIHAGRFR